MDLRVKWFFIYFYHIQENTETCSLEVFLGRPKANIIRIVAKVLTLIVQKQNCKADKYIEFLKTIQSVFFELFMAPGSEPNQ